MNESKMIRCQCWSEVIVEVQEVLLAVLREVAVDVMELADAIVIHLLDGNQ